MREKQLEKNHKSKERRTAYVTGKGDLQQLRHHNEPSH